MLKIKRSLPNITKIQLVNLGLLLMIVLISTAFVVSYITREQFFYYWDWGGFQSVAIYYATKFTRVPLRTLLQIKETINQEYNHYFAVPLLPIILILGKTRLSYVLSLMLVYQIPYALVAGGIATKLIPFRRGAVFWSAVLLAIATPVAWAPTLRAYPDIGAALIIGLAILVYVQDIRLQRWWQIPLIGILAGGALLFRRHFIFGSIAFFEAMILQTLVSFVAAIRQGHRLAWHALFKTGVRIGLIGATFLVVLLIVGRPFLVNALTTDYLALYSSYALTSERVITYYLANYGWITLALITLGFSIGISKRILDRPIALFLILFWGISLLQWTLTVRQIGVHYTLHFTLPVILGLTTFFWTIWLTTRGKIQAVITVFSIIIIVANLVVSLTSVNINPKLQTWVSWKYPPLVRSDYNEIVKLVDFLRATVPEAAPIYVVDSSSTMNFDLLIKAEQVKHNDQKLSIFVTPQIDSRDFYPLELLLRAKYVIVSTPVQYHLSNPEEQKVVKVVYQAFTESWDISEDFTRLPEYFNLANNIVLTIYRRQKPTSPETAVKTFAAMRDVIGRRPSSQSDWIIISPGNFSPIAHSAEHSWNTSIYPGQEEPETGYRLLFADLVPAHGVIRGKLEYLGEQCVHTILGVEIFDVTGRLTHRNELEILAKEKENHFELEFHSKIPNYLVFYALPGRTDSIDKYCPIRLEWNLTE